MDNAVSAGRRPRAGLVALLALCLASARPVCAEPSPALVPIELHAGFMRSSFSGVNEADAMAAFKVFAVRMGEKRGYAITPYVHIAADAPALAALMQQQSLSLIIIDVWDYLALAPLPNAPPTFSTVEQNVVMEEFLVLVRADSGIRTLADLAGKHVIVLRSSNANTVHHWFRTEILALDRGGPEAFLGRYEIKPQLSQAVLPVFFGKADACVVDQRGLQTMIELNPQIGKVLRELVRSAPFLDTLCCVRLEGWERPGMREDLIDAMQSMPDDPAGRQIMSLFKFNGVVPFAEQHLETMRALRQRYERLAGAARAPQSTAGMSR